MDPERFVFLDKKSATTNMTRRYGWAELGRGNDKQSLAGCPAQGPRSERLVDASLWGHWKTSTFVAGLRADGLIAPFVIGGAMNSRCVRLSFILDLTRGSRVKDRYRGRQAS